MDNNYHRITKHVPLPKFLRVINDYYFLVSLSLLPKVSRIVPHFCLLSPDYYIIVFSPLYRP